jgi:hypothetical protein
MLSWNEGSFQAHWLGGCRSTSVAGSALVAIQKLHHASGHYPSPQHHFVITAFNGRQLRYSLKMRPGRRSWSVLDARGKECLRCDEFFCPVHGRDLNSRSAAN